MPIKGYRGSTLENPVYTGLLMDLLRAEQDKVEIYFSNPALEKYTRKPASAVHPQLKRLSNEGYLIRGPRKMRRVHYSVDRSALVKEFIDFAVESSSGTAADYLNESMTENEIIQDFLVEVLIGRRIVEDESNEAVNEIEDALFPTLRFVYAKILYQSPAFLKPGLNGEWKKIQEGYSSKNETKKADFAWFVRLIARMNFLSLGVRERSILHAFDNIINRYFGDLLEEHDWPQDFDLARFDHISG